MATKNKSWFDINISTEEMEKELNILGSDGWDLVNTVDVNHRNAMTKEVPRIIE